MLATPFLLAAFLSPTRALHGAGSPTEPRSTRPCLVNAFFARVGDHEGRMDPLGVPEVARDVTLVAVLSSGSRKSEALAPLLTELVARHGERGLGVIGLYFEASGDFERDVEPVVAFTERTGLDGPSFVCGRADPALAERALGWGPLPGFPALFLFDRERLLDGGAIDGRADTAALRTRLDARILALLEQASPSTDEVWARLQETEWTVRADKPRRFGGERAVFRETEGMRGMRIGPGASRVDVRGACLHGVGTWYFDAEAGVILDPLRFGARLVPAGGTLTPLLERRGFSGEKGVLRALEDGDPLVRREALFALGDARRRKGAPEALPLLRDPDVAVRIAAAWALGEARETGAALELKGLSEDPYPPLRCAALSARVKARRDAQDFMQLAPLIQHDSDPLGKWAVLTEALD